MDLIPGCTRYNFEVLRGVFACVRLGSETDGFTQSDQQYSSTELQSIDASRFGRQQASWICNAETIVFHWCVSTSSCA